MLKNKNAQIGTTLTWFTAFIIIFFIIVIFVAFAFNLSSQKKIFSNGNSYEVVDGIGNGGDTRNLIDLMNYNGFKQNMISWIKDSDEGYLRVTVDNFIREINEKCYYFAAIQENGKYFEMGNQNLRKKSTSIFAIYENNKINLIFYSEKC